MKVPIFILGTQRSGTTLLTRILSAHPDLYIQNELFALPEIFGQDMDTDEITESVIKCIKSEAGIDLHDELIQKPEMSWGLKDPQLTEYIDDLRKFLPYSKFIIIVRDGRAVTNSYIENKWGLGTNAYTGAQRWKLEVEIQEAFINEAPDRFLCIRYEDLVADLEKTLIDVCNHLDVGFDPALLSYHEQQSYFQKKRENINTHKKLDKAIAQKWSKKLSAYQINVIEHVAGDILKRHNYELIGKPVRINFLQKLYFKLHQKIIGEFQLQYRWRKSELNRKKQQQVNAANEA